MSHIDDMMNGSDWREDKLDQMTTKYCYLVASMTAMYRWSEDEWTKKQIKKTLEEVDAWKDIEHMT